LLNGNLSHVALPAEPMTKKHRKTIDGPSHSVSAFVTGVG